MNSTIATVKRKYPNQDKVEAAEKERDEALRQLAEMRQHLDRKVKFRTYATLGAVVLLCIFYVLFGR